MSTSEESNKLELPESCNSLLNQIWKEACQKAEHQLDGEREALAAMEKLMEEETDKLKNKILELKEQLNVETKTLTETQEALKDSNQKIDELQKSSEASQAELQKSLDAAQADLNKEIEEKEKIETQLSEKYDQHKRELETARQEMEAVAEQHKKEIAELGNAQHGADKENINTINRLHAELDEAEQRLDHTQQELTEIEDENEILTREITALRQRVSDLEHRNAILAQNQAS